MPILNDPPKESDWIDPDEVPRPVVTYGFARAYVDGLKLDLHRHTKGQIVLVQRGALSCEVEGGLWIVPPRSAVWIPGGALHAVKATGVSNAITPSSTRLSTRACPRSVASCR
jgi:hypothetical protein